MTLRIAAAAPFKWAGTRTLPENEFVVALSLDRKWFSPDQAKRLIDVAIAQGVLTRTDSGIAVTFDLESITIPEGYTPDDRVLRETSTFERIIDRIVAADIEKREAVAAINRLQRDLVITIETAAILYATREGIDVSDFVDPVRRLLIEGPDG